MKEGAEKLASFGGGGGGGAVAGGGGGGGGGKLLVYSWKHRNFPQIPQ